MVGHSSFSFCTWLSIIDQFGDHLLGGSHSPLRIQRHDALVSIVNHALLQDHPGVLHDQSIASDQCRPGDIYHLDFTLGHPAYLDLSVRCTTQPSYFSSAASTAGVAVAAREEAKDDHYLKQLMTMVVTFFPWSASRLVFGLHLHYLPYLQLPTIPLLKVGLPGNCFRVCPLLFGNIMLKWFWDIMLCAQKMG